MQFKLSEKTSAIVRYLLPFEKGGQVTYQEISAAVGGEVDSRSHGLRYARLILQRDHNAVWVCVQPHVGVRRLTDSEIAERLRSWWLNGARRKLSAGSTQSEVVDHHSLDLNQMATFAVDVIQTHLAQESLSKVTRRRLERVARGTSNDLPSFTAVEWAINLTRRT